MTALESADYQIARDRIKGNPVISKMAAGVATVPLAELAHQDGTPRFAFMQHANRVGRLAAGADDPFDGPGRRTRPLLEPPAASEASWIAGAPAALPKISNCGGY